MIYKDNEQLKKYIDKMLIDIGMSKVELSRRMNCKPQQLNNRFNNERIGLNDLSNWLDALGYDLYIDFVKRD